MTQTVGSALAVAIAASSRSAWLRLRMPPPTTPTSTSAAAPPASKRRRCGERSGMNGLQFERSEEHTSELQSLMRISYAVFCLKQKQPPPILTTTTSVEPELKPQLLDSTR